MYKIVSLSKRPITCLYPCLYHLYISVYIYIYIYLYHLYIIYSPDVEIHIISLCPSSALVLKLLIFRVGKVSDWKIRYLWTSPRWDLFCIFMDLF